MGAALAATGLQRWQHGQGQTESQQGQQTLVASFFKAVPYNKCSLRWKQMINAVDVHIEMDMVPFTL